MAITSPQPLLLDCTLRDGGFVNDWNFGHDAVVNIFERLVSAKIDIIEVGFLDQRRPFDLERTIFPDMKSLNTSFEGLDKGESRTVAMIDYGTCGIENLLPQSESFVEGIRVIFKKQDRRAAVDFCAQIKALGYQTFVQAVSITSYTDEELDDLLSMVNELEPCGFSLVDTYGLLHKQQLSGYYHKATSVLKPAIAIGYHSHNNFQLAYANCVELLENPPADRTLLVDGSLYGMGKSAGNAPLELLAMYMNANCGKEYGLSQLLEAIDATILEIYSKYTWGYSLKFFIAASNDCHPSYVTYLIAKKKISIKGINEILAQIEKEKKLSFDEKYIEELYIAYQANDCDDSDDVTKLTIEIKGKDVLLLAPGSTVLTEKAKVDQFIQKTHPVVIAVNFLPDYPVDYAFLTNAKRYVQMSSRLHNSDVQAKTIATSNVTKTAGRFDFVLNYSSLFEEEALIVDNPLIMLLKLLAHIGAGKITLAGFDGYKKAEEPNYVNPNMEHFFSRTKAEEINQDTIQSLARLPKSVQVEYLTPSIYQQGKVLS